MTTGSGRGSQKKNRGASIWALLLNIARKQSRDYNALLIQYAQERFLYRLSVSPFSSHFLLKGALLLRVYPLPAGRPTKDIDLLGHKIGNEIPTLSKAIHAILEKRCNDGVIFLPEKTIIEKIIEQANYFGARAKVHCLIGGARITLQTDIGFGDVVIPGAVQMDYPVLLDFPVPHLNVYPLETSIAEKLQSLAKLGPLTSRMKDIYDIVFLAAHVGFSEKRIFNSISATFAQRGTSIESVNGIFSDEFSSSREMAVQWSAFLRLQSGGLQLEFPDAVQRLHRFIEPLILRTSPGSVWIPERWAWEVPKLPLL
jgi:predicted nucleotidyltransferase component of viral defense system